MKTISADEVGAFIQARFMNGRTITFDEDLLLTGQIDSLGIVALVAYLEETRGAPIPPEDVTLENFATVNAIVGYLNGA